MSTRDIREELAAVEEAAEQARDAEPKARYRSRTPRRDPAQVYSIRIPVEKIEALRRLAAHRNEAPTALMRAWVLERLEAETRQSRPATPAVSVDATAARAAHAFHAVFFLTGDRHQLMPGAQFRSALGLHSQLFEMTD